MKKLGLGLVFKEDFYQECGSPPLPIPFSFEDMQEFHRNNGISMTVIADNLLQMVGTDPDKIDTYKRLIVHICQIAGSDAARNENYDLSNHYFLQAAKFAPNSGVVRKNLARSYLLLHRYQDALDNYIYTNKVTENTDDSIWVYLIECLYLMGETEHARGITQNLLHNAEKAGLETKVQFGILATRLLSKDNAPEELKNLFRDFFTP
jgi:tetratricopeptide (TPR) repeat protein